MDANQRVPLYDIDALLKCGRLLGALSGDFARLSEGAQDARDVAASATVAALALTRAQSYVLELAAHLTSGTEMRAALAAAVRGDLSLSGTNEV